MYRRSRDINGSLTGPTSPDPLAPQVVNTSRQRGGSQPSGVPPFDYQPPQSRTLSMQSSLILSTVWVVQPGGPKGLVRCDHAALA